MIGYLFKGGGPERAKEIAKYLEIQREEKKVKIEESFIRGLRTSEDSIKDP